MRRCGRLRVAASALAALLSLAGSTVGQPPPEDNAVDDAWQAFARRLGELAQPIPDDRNAATVTADRLESAATAGYAFLELADNHEVDETRRLDAQLMLAQVELGRERFGAALDLLGQVLDATRPSRVPDGGEVEPGSWPSEEVWPPARRRRHIESRMLRIRVWLARAASGDPRLARAELAELREIDRWLADRVAAELFPPFFLLDPAPLFTLREPAWAVRATGDGGSSRTRDRREDLLERMRDRNFSHQAIEEAARGVYSLSALRGAVVVLVFWRGDRGVDLLADLHRQAAEWPDRPLLILGVNLDPTDRPLQRAMQPVSEREDNSDDDAGDPDGDDGAPRNPPPAPLPLPQIHDGEPLGERDDPTDRLRVLYGVRTVPTVVVIDGAGRVAGVFSGAHHAGRIRDTVSGLMR